MKKISVILIISILVIVLFFWWKQNFYSQAEEVNFIFTGILQGRILPFVQKGGPYKGKLMGGLAYLSKKLKDFRSAKKYFVLDCGDDLSGTPESYYTRGEAVIRGLNYLKIDAFNLGNREFDFGVDSLLKNVNLSNFVWLGTNLEKEERAPFSLFWKKEVILKSGKLKIGVVGIVPPNTPAMTEAHNTRGFIFKGIEVVKDRIEKLREKGIDIVVVVSQFDVEADTEVITKLVSYEPDILQVLRYNYSLPAVKKEGKTFIVAHDGYAKGTNFLACNFVYEKSRGLQLIASKVIPVFKGEKVDFEVSKVINEYVRKIDVIMDEVLAEMQNDGKNEYYKESSVGDLIADIILERSGADLVIQNSGGIRADIKKGKFTRRNLHDVLPFDNDILVLEMSGRDLEEVFKRTATLRYGVLQIAGGKYKIEKKKLAYLEIGGKPVDPNKTYRVAVNSFLANGGDGYVIFKKAKKIKNIGALRDIIAAALKSKGKIALKTDGRIIVED